MAALSFSSFTRFLGGLVLCGALVALAGLPLSTQAAGFPPRISATVQSSTAIHVNGVGFYPGDTVLVEVKSGTRILARLTTRASFFPLPLPTPRPLPCTSPNQCQQIVYPFGGTIAVTLHPQPVHCVIERVRVRAFDRTHVEKSNVVYLDFGTGLCRAIP